MRGVNHRFVGVGSLCLGLCASALAQTAPEVAAGAVPSLSLTRPGLVAQSTISAADTAWMMTSTALVLLMTLPGIALFYAGMVRKKNVLNTMASVVAIAALVSLLWFGAGYSLAFTPGSPWLGGWDRIGFAGLDFQLAGGKLAVSHVAPHIPESVYAMFQLTFAIITAALLVGALVERMRFSAMLVFIGLWTLVVYAPVAHWVWEPGGWLAQMGALDFAGGTVVHINAGIAGLVGCLMIGKRLGYGREATPPHSLTMTMIGASLLFVGWFVDRLGVRVAYSIAVIVWSAAGMAHALAQTVQQFVAARIVLAAGESVSTPAGLKAAAMYLPVKERNFAIGLINTAPNIGAILTPLLIPR